MALSPMTQAIVEALGITIGTVGIAPAATRLLSIAEADLERLVDVAREESTQAERSRAIEHFGVNY